MGAVSLLRASGRSRGAPALLVSAAVLMLSGCSGAVRDGASQRPPAGERSPAATATASAAAVSVPLQRITGSPARQASAGVQIAFERATAESLVADLPAQVDFGTRAVLCLAIGARTGDWSVVVQSVTVSGHTMAILAREKRPGPGAPAGRTFPADCVLVERALLPAGDLAVRADDTTSGEFIVEATIPVPAR